MFSGAILLFIAVSLSLAKEVPLVQVLPEKSFTASSFYNDSVKASNVRFPSSSGMPKEPWCSGTQNDTDEYFKQFVTVDLGCPQTVHKVEGKDPNAQYYAVEYSNNKTGWTNLTSEHKAFYKNSNSFETDKAAEIIPTVRGRFFKFRITEYSHTVERRSHPCIKVELYGSPDLQDSVQPTGCFTETKRTRHLPYVYHTVKGKIDKKYPDILAVYDECKQKAANYSKPIEIFGIWNFKQCVTTETGRDDAAYLESARNSGKCKTCQGKGIGTRQAVFVYKK